jgi:D-alanyl-D-alanine carboxypeptidase
VAAVSRAVRIVVGCCLLAAVVTAGAAVAPAQEAPEGPAAWILVERSTGVVLDGENVHEPRPAASVSLLMTALVAVQRLPTTPPEGQRNPVVVSREATRVPTPKLGLGQADAWDVRLLLNAILLSEANDVAYALAESGSGNVAAFAGDMNSFGELLGLRDSTWTDPMGDDDNAETSNLTSAWDLAMVASASLRIAELRSILEDKEETINGPQLGRRVVNNNELVQRYPGATGLKQGVSEKAGSVLVGSAERDGRELIVVVMGLQGDPVSFAVEKLDAAFASSPRERGVEDPVRPARIATAQSRLEALLNLPPSLGSAALLPGAFGAQAPSTPATTVPASRPSDRVTEEDDGGGSGILTLTNVLIAIMFVGLIVIVVMRRRAIMMKQRRRVGRRRALDEAKRRGSIDFVDADQVTGSSHVRIVRPGERRPGRVEREV